jgi:hypothetical protein
MTTGQSFEAWVEASRQAQGLPPRIEDPDVLLRAAGMVAAALRRQAEGGGRRGP